MSGRFHRLRRVHRSPNAVLTGHTAHAMQTTVERCASQRSLNPPASSARNVVKISKAKAVRKPTECSGADGVSAIAGTASLPGRWRAPGKCLVKQELAVTIRLPRAAVSWRERLPTHATSHMMTAWRSRHERDR